MSEPHHLRTRRIGNNYAIEIHIRMDGNISLHKAHETATGIEHRLKKIWRGYSCGYSCGTGEIKYEE